MGVAIVIGSIVVITVLWLLIDKLINKGYNSARNARARKREKNEPHEAVSLADRYTKTDNNSN